MSKAIRRERRATRRTATERHASEAKRRQRVAARHLLAGMGAKGPIAKIAYHSAGKDEITVREIKIASAVLRVSKKGSPYIRAYDYLRGEPRTFTVSRMGWVTAA
ncbi:hypothetical protein ACFU98_10705 [Streptomyces sp. NPDC057575]|uniref:WYL domain-containing protein n=1 Tax=unclassified Streptomyces TaxID=2593676 RepID=UPI0036966D7C